MPAELQIALALISTTTVVVGFVFAAYQFIAADPDVGAHVSRKGWKP